MKIYIASDHAGFEMKEKLVSFLRMTGHDVEDLGAKKFDENDDYPEYILPLARKVAENPESRGIILGGSGQGEAIAANRIDGVRAAEYYGGNKKIVTLSREHNDSNVLSLGARFVSVEEAKEAIRLWLATPFSGDERHTRRIREIDELT